MVCISIYAMSLRLCNPLGIIAQLGIMSVIPPMNIYRPYSIATWVFQPGFICYGIPVGSKSYVKHHLSLKVKEVAREVGEVLTTLEGEGQAIWTVARSTTLMKLDYHISLCYPSDMAEAARQMDQLLWSRGADPGRVLRDCGPAPLPALTQLCSEGRANLH